MKATRMRAEAKKKMFTLKQREEHNTLGRAPAHDKRQKMSSVKGTFLRINPLFWFCGHQQTSKYGVLSDAEASKWSLP